MTLEGSELSACTATQFLSALAHEPVEVVEEWKPIPGSGGFYSVSSTGRVRSEPIQTSRVGRQRGRVLKVYPDDKGYLQFRMSLPGGRHRTMKVHRAVALAFLGPRPPGCQINHRSGDKLDNSVGNLEYVTCRENIRHGWHNGLYRSNHARGERNVRAKLTADDVRLIRRLKTTMSLTELARQFAVTPQAIWHVVKSKTWNHVV